MDELERVVNEGTARFPEQSVVVAVADASGTRVVPSAGTGPDMLCEVGSVTKVMTATLVLQHVARGDVGLDDPVASYVTDFVLDPPDATPRVTHWAPAVPRQRGRLRRVHRRRRRRRLPCPLRA